MTAPRRIVANTTYLLTRRCIGRAFLLRPSKLVNAVFQFALALTAQRYGILLHCYCVLSNHYHCVLTDPFGKLPEFERDLGSILARALNAAHGRWESFWAPGSYSAVALQSADDVLQKMAYVLANPVAAGLVRRGTEWPGLWSSPERIGAGPVQVSRPDHFFRKDGPCSEPVDLDLVSPPGFDSIESLRGQLAAAVTRLEDRAARRLAAQGRSFMGPRKVLAQSVHARPAPGEPRRELNPRIASRDKWKRLEAIHRLQSFLAAYRTAWESFSAGVRAAVFPVGTYWMRVAYGVSCAEVSSPA